MEKSGVQLIFPYWESSEKKKQCWSQKELWGLLPKDMRGSVSQTGHAERARPEVRSKTG